MPPEPPGPSLLAPSPPSGRVRRLALWLLVGVGLLTVGPFADRASAHATLVATVPAAEEVVAERPSSVVLTFDEPVDTAGGGITVLDPAGEEAQRGDARRGEGGRELTQAIGDLGPEGTYTVSYRVLSEDGHVIAGSYVFHVGQRTGAAGPAEEPALPRVLGALGRWVAFAGALLAGGVVAMAAWVDRGPGRSWTGGLDRSRRLLLPAAVAVLVGSAAAVLASAADLAGGSLVDGLSGIGDVVASGRTGTVAGLRVVVALVLLVAVAGRTLLVRVPWLAMVAVAATVVLPSFGGHAATASPAAVAVLADAGHVVAAAVWVGGLAVLVLSWVADRDRLVRYSAMAFVAAPILVATGAVSAWLQLRGTSALVDTDYGRMVLAKVVGAGVMLGLGLVHRRRLTGPVGAAAFRPTLVAQSMIGVAVLAVTAVLVTTPPPADDAAAGDEPVTVQAAAGSTEVRMEVLPAAAGPNDLHLYYSTSDGQPAPVDAAELTISTDGVEPRKVPLTAITTSHATALDVQLTAGTWRFALTLVAGGIPATTTFEVPVR